MMLAETKRTVAPQNDCQTGTPATSPTDQKIVTTWKETSRSLLCSIVGAVIGGLCERRIPISGTTFTRMANGATIGAILLNRLGATVLVATSSKSKKNSEPQTPPTDRVLIPLTKTKNTSPMKASKTTTFQGLEGSISITRPLLTNTPPLTGNSKKCKTCSDPEECRITLKPNNMETQKDFLQRIDGVLRIRDNLIKAGVPIPKVIGAFLDTSGKQGLQIVILEENGGRDLYSYLDDPSLTNPIKFRIAIQLATAVLTMHNKGVVHRDIKPENIVINSNGFAPSLIDFDFAREKSEPTNPPFCGTPGYISPTLTQLNLRNPEIQFQQLKSADIWALGLTLLHFVVDKGDAEKILNFVDQKQNNDWITHGSRLSGMLEILNSSLKKISEDDKWRSKLLTIICGMTDLTNQWSMKKVIEELDKLHRPLSLQP